MSLKVATKSLRSLDIALSILGLFFFFVVILVLILISTIDGKQSGLFFQKRVGKHHKTFTMIKIRTMSKYSNLPISRFGLFLRKSKLDELPQLVNVILGDMSFVGPRPCLLSQTSVIEERVKRNVFDCLPGITGLAQINKIDMSTPALLAETDAQMLKNLTVLKYFYYIIVTVVGKGSGDRILHK